MKELFSGNAFEIEYQNKFPFVKISKHNLFDIFFIALIVGVVAFFAETIIDYIDIDRLCDRGFLIGPFLPIYFCVVFVGLCFIKTPKASISNFFLYTLILGSGISLVEFLVGNFFELAFNTVLWTYDGMFPLSYKYVSLIVALIWGVLGTLIAMFVLPLLKRQIDKKIKEKYHLPIVIVFISIFLIDLIATLVIIAKNDWVYQELYGFEATTDTTLIILGIFAYILLALYLGCFFYRRFLKFPKISLIIYFISVLIPFISVYVFLGQSDNAFLSFVAGIGFIIIVFYIYFLLSLIFINIVRYIVYLFSKKSILKSKLFKGLSIYCSIIPCLIIIPIGIFCGFNPKVTTLNVGTGQEKLNIVAVSDIHYGTIGVDIDLNKLSNEINKLNPDVVFLLGDVIDNKIENIDIDYFNENMSKIKTKYGIYAILGNHEYEYNYFSEIKEFYNSTCINLLADEYKIIEDVLVIGRVDYIDSYSRKPLDKIVPETISQQFSSIIVLDHQPQDYEDSKNYNVTLQLSGHTHNGQVFPINLLVKIYSQFRYGANVVNGLYKEDDFTMYVTGGYGMWGVPLRTTGRSEILQINYYY